MTALTASFAGRTIQRVGYGAMQLERLRDRRDEAVALLRRAVELSVNHVDTAEFYGFGFANAMIRAYCAPRMACWSSRRSVPTRTRAAGCHCVWRRPEQLRASVEDNLRSLGVDQLPVVNLRRLDAGPRT